MLSSAAMSQTLLSRLPQGVISKTLRVRDLEMHILQAGQHNAPLILLLHGFPELAFSWRRVMPSLAAAGFCVVAPDQRGFGGTKSITAPTRMIEYEDEWSSFRILNATHDVVALVYALGYTSAVAVIGHDFGSPVAGLCAFIRPDLFRSVVCMSTPIPSPPPFPFDVERTGAPARDTPPPAILFNKFLGSLDPPMKHYTVYFSQPRANTDMMNSPQGMHAFLRAYFHVKSADWPGNDPRPLAQADPSALTKLPHYYIMPADATMPEAVQPYSPSEEETSRNLWLSDADLNVWVVEYSRTGFQGGLNWYRAMNTKERMEEVTLFSGMKMQVPAMYLSGAKDWGVYQVPGALDKMRELCGAHMPDENVVLIDGAGHWVQQEQPDAVVQHILRFVRKNNSGM